MEQATTTETVLFVDDEPSILAAIRRGLFDEPYHCLFAQSGEEALALLETEPVAVSLLFQQPEATTRQSPETDLQQDQPIDASPRTLVAEGVWDGAPVLSEERLGLLGTVMDRVMRTMQGGFQCHVTSVGVLCRWLIALWEPLAEG